MAENLQVASNEVSRGPTNFAGQWVLGIVVALSIAWIGYSFPPVSWRIPDDMLHIGALSPPDDQARLKVVENNNLWMNTLVKFTLAGAGIGLAGFFIIGRRDGRYLPVALATLAAGVVAGCLSGVLGLLFRQYLDTVHPLPLVSDENRSLVIDTLVFIVNCMLLLLPLALLLRLQPDRESKHKSGSILLAGFIAGAIVPFTTALTSTLFTTHTSTSVYPPRGAELTVMWFGAMAVIPILFIIFSKPKSPKVAPQPSVNG